MSTNDHMCHISDAAHLIDTSASNAAVPVWPHRAVPCGCETHLRLFLSKVHQDLFRLQMKISFSLLSKANEPEVGF